MFKLLFALIRSIFFMVSVTVAFLIGAVVSNLDRLGSMEAKLLSVKSLIPQNIFAGKSPAYTRPAPKMTLTGRVLEVYDGDTLTMVSEGRRVRVRLFGIDAPEALQEYGVQSGNKLRQLVLGRIIRADILSVDPYGRGVGDISCGGIAVNTEMVRSGCAWHCRQYAEGDTALAEAEKEARSARRGLWNLPDPLPPWEYRRILKQDKPFQSGKSFHR